MKILRREVLKRSGVAMGGLLLASPLNDFSSPPETKESDPSQKNCLFDALPVFQTGEQLIQKKCKSYFLEPLASVTLTRYATTFYLKLETLISSFLIAGYTDSSHPKNINLIFSLS